MGYAVKILLSSGTQRTVDGADAARMDGPFFIITKRQPDNGRIDTLLTLRSDDVVAPKS